VSLNNEGSGWTKARTGKAVKGGSGGCQEKAGSSVGGANQSTSIRDLGGNKKNERVKGAKGGV